MLCHHDPVCSPPRHISGLASKNKSGRFGPSSVKAEVINADTQWPMPTVSAVPVPKVTSVYGKKTKTMARGEVDAFEFSPPSQGDAKKRKTSVTADPLRR